MAPRKKTTENVDKDIDVIETIFSFTFGRSIYTIALDKIEKVTLLEHSIVEQVDDKKELKKKQFIFNITTDKIISTDEKTLKPIYESLMEVQGKENDYDTLYKIYVNLLTTWNRYRSLKYLNRDSIKH